MTALLLAVLVYLALVSATCLIVLASAARAMRAPVVVDVDVDVMVRQLATPLADLIVQQLDDLDIKRAAAAPQTHVERLAPLSLADEMIVDARGRRVADIRDGRRPKDRLSWDRPS